MKFNNKKNTMNIASRNLESDFESANRSMALGDLQSAREQFTEILKIDSTHLGTLINFAVLLVQTGYNSAAKTAYLQALSHHPTNLLAHVNLGNLYFQERFFKKAEEHYEKVLSLVQSLGAQAQNDPLILANSAHAHQGLALIHFEEGRQDQADFHHSVGFSLEPVRAYPSAPLNPVPSMLILIGGRGGDLPWPSLVESKHFSVDTLACEFWEKSKGKIKSLFDYDLILNAVGDADSSLRSLQAAQKFLEQCFQDQSTLSFNVRPIVLNSPQSVLLSGRQSNAERFKEIPFVKTPNTVLLPRSAFTDPLKIEQALEEKIKFPVVVRSLGFQTGKHFEFAATVEDLRRVAQDLPGGELLVMEFLNARDSHGYFNKYRVMFIEGKMYPIHLALSSHWKVHYFSAAMKDSPENRAKEQYFLEHMHEALGESAIRALESIGRELALDYVGVDFGLNERGEVLLFEANATMIMAAPPVDKIWDYRRHSIQTARQAAQQMLIRKARSDRKHCGTGP
jgi:tetratricopeptide (TPR) repeat protein